MKPEDQETKPAPQDKAPAKTSKKPDGKQPSKKGGTATGQPASQIDVNPSIELPLNPVLECVIAFGRFNPPTAGHDALADAVLAESITRNAAARIYASHREDNDRNPLPRSLKSALAEAAFGELFYDSEAKDLFQVLADVNESYNRIVVVAGEDRVEEWNRRITAGNGRFFTFESWEVVSAGKRAGEGVENVSGTQLREAVKRNDRETFRKNISANLSFMADDIFECIQSVYETGALDEALNMSQRMKRALQMKRYKGILKTARKRALARRGNTAVISKRAKRVAIAIVRKRLLRNIKYKDATYGQRQRIDAIIAKRRKAITRLTRKVIPRLRQAEARRAIGSVARPNTKGLREATELQTVSKAIHRYVTEAAPVVPALTRRYLNDKAARNNINEEELLYVYQRGLLSYELSDQHLTKEQWAMNAVNSYVAGGLSRAIASKELK